MLLSTFDRLILLNILPAEGDITTIRVIHQLRLDLSFSEAENAALAFETGEDGLVRWKTDADVPKEVEIGPKAHAIVAATLERLNKQEKLTEQHLSLYERFVEST
jgi:hypothetical protein